MSSTKALVKAVAEAVKGQKWVEAIQSAHEVLEKDRNNYQGHILLAFALDKENKLEEAEKHYVAATRIKGSGAQAWQGLIKLYQRQGKKKLRQYQDAALQLAEVYRDAEDMNKCQDVVDTFVNFVRGHGDELQYVDALDLMLPECPLYPALEGRVPHPAMTYQTQAEIVESEEKKRINTLIGERRTRIGARIGEVTLNVKREVFGSSRLDSIYDRLINWAADDVRRTYEEKLLRYCYERLVAWPAGPEKQRELRTVRKLANDMVTIRHPFRLAWDIAIDWQDHKEIREWDVTVLREYSNHFPDSNLSRVLTGYLTSAVSPFPAEKAEQTPGPAAGEDEDESEDGDDGGVPTNYIPRTEDERQRQMIEGIEDADSLLAYRLGGEYYQELEEHESNMALMRKALKRVQNEQAKTGLGFQNTKNAMSLLLGTALVALQSPRHYDEAKVLLEGAMEHDRCSTAALMGLGRIYEEEGEYDKAAAVLRRAREHDAANVGVRVSAAWILALQGDYGHAKEELEPCVPLLSRKGQAANKALLAQTQYRLGVCVWNLESSETARRNRSGAYALFVAALKNDANYAPTYSMLGIFYADYAGDGKRARKCFLKAVELSASEVESAERLARSFADDGDWDRAELVAQRVVDHARVQPPPESRRKGISWPVAVLGVANLSRGDYGQAIVHFQAALRIAPGDYDAWIGLGESYLNAGRHAAAAKAIVHAQRLEQEGGVDVGGDRWVADFMLGNIKRELGEYDEAAALYRQVLAGRDKDEAVTVALMQTLAASALDCRDKGFFGRSTRHATEALQVASRARATETFNFWKAVGDSCAIFASIQSRAADFPTQEVQQLLGDKAAPAYQPFRDLDKVGVDRGHRPDEADAGGALTQCVHAMILAHKRAMHVSAHDLQTLAVAHYNLGWAEYQAHTCLESRLQGRPSRYLKAAVGSFKRAIELEAANADFWNAFGVVTSGIDPAVSQHAFVRSLYLDERSAVAWTNLGTLALLRKDVPMAGEAFARAQSTDPDAAHAWLGQGVVALMTGDANEARGLFSHALELAACSSVPARTLYAVSLFDVLSPNLPLTALVQPVFALGQLQALRPHDWPLVHLLALFRERSGDLHGALDTLDTICATCEAEYAATASLGALRRFVLAKTDLARSCLATGLFGKAIEAGELAMQLSSLDEADPHGPKAMLPAERRKARLSVHLTVGLARFHAGNVGGATSCFEAALDESANKADIVCLLAQVLWATGAEAGRDRARELLFGVIADAGPLHVQSVVLLGVIALLDDDAESLDAVVSELEGLRAGGIHRQLTAREQAVVADVLGAVALLSLHEADAKVLAQAQTDVMLHPYLPHGWRQVAAAARGGRDAFDDSTRAADMAVRVASKAVPPRGDLTPEDLACAYAGTGRIADAQVAIVVAPWQRRGWTSLAEAVCWT